MRRHVVATASLLCLAFVAISFAGRIEAQPRLPQPLRIPRTPDGRPDFQGVWNFATLTPLERPAQFAGRPFMTDEEAAAFEAKTLARMNADRRGDSPESDLGGGPAINEFWFERGRLAVVNGRKPSSLITDPPDGQLPAFLPAVQQRQQERRGRADGPEDLALSERCLFSSGIPMWPSQEGNLLRIVQGRDTVALVKEARGDRLLILGTAPHVSPRIRSWMGDARARWVGDTLVVDTSNFTSQLAFVNMRTLIGGPSTRVNYDENLHLIERFTLVDRETLLYEFTVEDPTTFTRAWTAILPMIRTDKEIYEVACHEGNYTLRNILSGARAEDAELSRRSK